MQFKKNQGTQRNRTVWYSQRKKKIEQHRLSLKKELMEGQKTKILKDFRLAQIEQSTKDLWKTTA